MPLTQYLTRWQVRTPSQRWTDAGPDLLRPRGRAVNRALALVPRLGLRLEVNRHDGTGWHRVKRRGIGWQVEHTDGPALSIAQVKPWGTRVVRVQMRRVRVAIKPLANTSPATVIVHSLIEHAFPGVLFGGSYVWTSAPGGYSDHAWGTAVDETENPRAGVRNDATFDWVARMGRAGCMAYDYALGSRNGRVVNAQAVYDYAVRDGGGDTTHLWHTHVSVVNHHGARPPRMGGVW